MIEDEIFHVINADMILSAVEFVQALDNLGFDIEFSTWGFDGSADKPVLFILTDFFDYKGPLALSQALFKASNAAPFPSDFDPFLVRFQSPQTQLAQELRIIARARDPIIVMDDGSEAKLIGLTDENAPLLTFDNGMSFRTPWIVKDLVEVRRKTLDISRRWQRFQRNLEQMAA